MVVLINLWYTVKGKLGAIHADIGAKFVFTGTIYISLSTSRVP